MKPRATSVLLSLLIRPGPEGGEENAFIMFNGECCIFSKTWEYRFGLVLVLEGGGWERCCTCSFLWDPGTVTPPLGP